jgi:hypothetical protein
MEQLIQSAALYCHEGGPGHVTREWLEGAINLLRSHGQRVREYAVADNPVCSEGTYDFRDNDPQLDAAIRSGALRSLYLYCHSHKLRGLLFSWEGAASINLAEGNAHVGLPVMGDVSLDELLRQTYLLSKPFALWQYGIGYFRSSEKAPSLYAAGILGGTRYPDPNESEEDRERIGCWYRELLFAGRRRHLRGYLRDIYPANLLSTEHVNARAGDNKTLLTAGWGTFTPLDDGIWIWTVPDEDIPEARATLLRADLLICP